MFGLPGWMSIIVWCVASLLMGVIANKHSVGQTGQPSWAATGFFTGNALGPLGILASTSSATKGNRRAIFIGGLVGTAVYANFLGLF